MTPARKEASRNTVREPSTPRHCFTSIFAALLGIRGLVPVPVLDWIGTDIRAETFTHVNKIRLDATIPCSADRVIVRSRRKREIVDVCVAAVFSPCGILDVTATFAIMRANQIQAIG
jgi:hypothetical protein